MISLTYILNIQYKTVFEYMIYVGRIGHFRLDIIICYQQLTHKLLLQELNIITCLCTLQIKQKQTKGYVLK